jgi:hypothetical protein
MRRLAAALALALALATAFSACRRKSPVAPPPPATPAVVAVQPPARSAAYAYDGQIWALFDRPLDPASVDTTTVFLKKDTQRLRCDVRYEPTSRRIVIVPKSPLGLNTTYTVVLTALIRSREGAALGADYLWQFSTSCIRRLTYVLPSPTVPATRVAMLSWSSPDAVPGTLLFDVYAGPDSMAVAARTAPKIHSGTSSYYLPRQYWPAGQRVYWAVSTTNQSTGEQLASAVTSFTVMPNGAPTRLVTATMLEYGGIQLGRPATQFCTSTILTVGTGYNAAVKFDLDPARLGTRVHSARLVMHATNNANYAPYLLVWSSTPANWTGCGMVYPGPPYTEFGGVLGAGSVGSPSSQIVLESIALSAWTEGMLRRGGDFSGLMFTMSVNTLVSLYMGTVTHPRPVLEITTYD